MSTSRLFKTLLLWLYTFQISSSFWPYLAPFSFLLLQQNAWDQLITKLDIDENPSPFRRLYWDWKATKIRKHLTLEIATTIYSIPLTTKNDFLGKISNDDPEDNDFDYDHIKAIEQSVTDNFE